MMRVASFGEIAGQKSFDSHMIVALVTRMTEALDVRVEKVVVRFLIVRAHETA